MRLVAGVLNRADVEIAVDDGRFETLVAALQAADLVETLAGPGPFTVFAPTDDTFAKLPEGTVEALLGDIPALTAILLYHVVPGNVTATDIAALDSATTMQGGTVAISIEGDTVRINDAQVVIADIEAANGTIHVIDTDTRITWTTGHVHVTWLTGGARPNSDGHRLSAGVAVSATLASAL
ncbi:MAG: fasciclin domain-containing protein [Caldilineaceae bacterium SB0662_bin_9]|uniref:Fasciclin domain-containing protein n=1 Tax=Caldilineaceae bacterium SB0662_bin_9 TaxID=2605258 RepID=A0A6B1DU06_9CHLR|nr:fasciclin domain-containing protein [Caldilineaceae bacterium SB0662_bin_9]